MPTRPMQLKVHTMLQYGETPKGEVLKEVLQLHMLNIRGIQKN